MDYGDWKKKNMAGPKPPAADDQPIQGAIRRRLGLGNGSSVSPHFREPGQLPPPQGNAAYTPPMSPGNGNGKYKPLKLKK